MANDIYSLGKHFLAGGFGGMCGLVTGHPLDTIKLRLQTQPTNVVGMNPLYQGMTDCIRKIYLGEGITGFYKGMLAPLALTMPMSAVGFTGFALGKRLQTPAGENGRYSLLQLFQAGAFSGLCLTVIVPPCERVKCLLQVQIASKSTGKYSGLFDCMRQIFKEAGLFRGLYRGTVITAIRDIPGHGFYFLAYEAVLQSFESRRQIPRYSQHERSLAEVMVAGGCAGIAYWIYSIAPDTVKSRVQTAPEGKYPKGMRDVVREILRQDGIPGFFKGITPVLIRALPACAAGFLGYETMMKIFHQYS